MRALRSHPSLIAWCGGNEISPRRERLPLDALRGSLRKKTGRGRGFRPHPATVICITGRCGTALRPGPIWPGWMRRL